MKITEGRKKPEGNKKPQSPKETLAWLHGSILQKLNKAKEKDFKGTCPLEVALVRAVSVNQPCYVASVWR